MKKKGNRPKTVDFYGFAQYRAEPGEESIRVRLEGWREVPGAELAGHYSCHGISGNMAEMHA